MLDAIARRGERKRRLGRSPDRGDAVVMAFTVGASAGNWSPPVPTERTRALSAGLIEKLF